MLTEPQVPSLDPTDPLVERAAQLLAGIDTPFEKLSQEALVSVLKLIRDTTDLHDLSMVATTLKEFRQSFKVFSPFRDVRKVCIFGSARTPEDDPDYQNTMKFSNLITHRGFMVITGAGPGIMEAGNRGAEVDMSFGLNIKLPFEQQPNKYIDLNSKLVSFKYFFTRKLMFLKESDATVLFPGGFGTHDEAFESLTLLQTGRCAPRPLVLLASEGNSYWTQWRDFVESEVAGKGFISKEDLSLFTVPSSVEEAVEQVSLFYQTYHSVRYFQDLAVIRLNSGLKPSTVSELNRQFSDLLRSGQFELVEPDQFAMDSHDYQDKYRLVFRFDKMSFGRLCQLIWALNYLEKV